MGTTDLPMIPIVDLSDADALREQLVAHPLYLRRAEIERAFLDELTHLTRKYGLEIEADTRSEYGETYPEHVLTVPHEGTEGRYLLGSFGIEFSAAQKGDLLPCDADERAQYEAAKKARDAEDKIIDGLSRKISDAHWKAMEAGREAMFTRHIAEMREKRPTSFVCTCGEKFKKQPLLDAHAKKTGHRKP